LPFDDGDPPPKEIVNTWLNLVAKTFPQKNVEPKEGIGIHCLAGLGKIFK
jgi:hypothetical protein